MISVVDYLQLKAYARIEGLIFGLWGVVTFACFIGSLHDAGLEMLSSIGVICMPFFAFYRLRRFRDKVLGGEISFRRGFAYLAFSFGYASFIMMAAAYVYFNFVDNGDFLSMIEQRIMMPEMQEAFRQTGVDTAVLRENINALAEVRPIDIAFSILVNGLVMGFFLSLFLGFVCQRKVKSEK